MISEPREFKTSKPYGDVAEEWLDKYFMQSFKIIKVTDVKIQRLGIDRYYYAKGNRWTDDRATETGNIFIETISRDAEGIFKEGWAVYTQAEWVIHYIKGLKKIIITETKNIRDNLPLWIARYKIACCPNKEYNSWGRLVPITIYEGIAKKTINLEEVI